MWSYLGNISRSFWDIYKGKYSIPMWGQHPWLYSNMFYQENYKTCGLENSPGFMREFLQFVWKFLTCDNEYKCIVSNVSDIASFPPRKKKSHTQTKCKFRWFFQDNINLSYSVLCCFPLSLMFTKLSVKEQNFCLFVLQYVFQQRGCLLYLFQRGRNLCQFLTLCENRGVAIWVN